MNKKLLGLLALIIFFNLNNLQAQDVLINGRIEDFESGKPIAGATVRLVETNKGTYTSGNGKFRLLIPHGKQILKISSLGYDSQKINLENKRDTIVIRLKANPLLLKGVEVTANIDANNLIKRAIKRKSENMNKIKTFSGLLYSKMVIELEGTGLSQASSNNGAISITTNLSGSSQSEADAMSAFLLETFSKTYVDYTKALYKNIIIQRRQTSNIGPENNLLALGNFLSFYEDKIKILDAEFVTPLAEDAFDYYEYQIKQRTILDDRFVYVVSVKPTTTIYPAFTGTISIVEGTYNLVAIDLMPSENSSIAFVKNLTYIQKFEEVRKDIWFPTYLDLTADTKIEVLKGFLDFGAKLKATSIYSDMTINEPLPDSLYNQELPRITVDKSADTADNRFWESNSLREIAPYELDLYSKVDSAVAKRDSIEKNAGLFDYSFAPEVEFNRTISACLGASLKLEYGNLALETPIMYSFGLKEPIGSTNLSYDFEISENVNFAINLNAFYSYDCFGTDDSYSKLLNTISSALFHKDYYNYYKTEGYKGGFGINYKDHGVWFETESSLISAMNITTSRSLFQKRKWRSNPQVTNDRVHIARAGFDVGNLSDFSVGSEFDYYFEAEVFYGQNKDKYKFFRGAEAKLKMNIPTFNTGYHPMMLSLSLASAICSDRAPVQYQFNMPTGLPVLGTSYSMLSAPIMHYGGTEYFMAKARFNTSDLWWRAIGLPLYEGRGPELLFNWGGAKFINHSLSNLASTRGQVYTEAGWGLSRIPTFISNVAYLSAEFSWGIGPLAKNRFGWMANITLPF